MPSTSREVRTLAEKGMADKLLQVGPRNLSMKATLTLLILTMFGSVAKAEQDPGRFSVRGDLARAKKYFAIVKHLDERELAAAEALFKTIDNTNGSGGFRYEHTARYLRERDYDLARETCNWDIDFWIIDTAADSQVPALTSLLDNPERLRFLQDLAAYRKKFPATTAEGKKSEALVADILRKASERKK